MLVHVHQCVCGSERVCQRSTTKQANLCVWVHVCTCVREILIATGCIACTVERINTTKLNLMKVAQKLQ